MLDTAAAFFRKRTHRLDAEFRVLVHNSSWIFASNAVRTGLAFIKAIIIARGLGVSGYGTYVLILAFTTTIREVYDLNLSSAIIKFGAEYRAEKRPDKLVALIKAGMLLSTGVAVAAVLTAWLLSLVSYERLVDMPGLGLFIVAFAIAVSAQLFDMMCLGLLRLFYKFRVTSILAVVLGVVDLLVIALVLWLYPRQLEPFLIAMIIATFFNSLIINAVALWELWPELRSHADAPMRLLLPQRKELTTFLVSNSGTKTLQNIMNRGDVLLLGFMSTTEQVGFYEIGRRIAYAIVRLTDPLAISINPQTSKLIAERRFAELLQLLRKATTLLAVPAAVCVVIALLFAKPGIAMFLGPEFVPTAVPLFIHLVAACVYAVVFWAAPVLLGLGKTVFRFWAAAGTLLLGIIVAGLLAPAYGATGVAIASLVAKCSLLLLSAAVAFRLLRARVGTEPPAAAAVEAQASA